MTNAFARVSIVVSVVSISLVLVACGSDTSSASSGSGGGGDACNSLCTGAAFTSGKALTFPGVVECECEGAGNGTGIPKSACESYCGTNHKTAPEKSFVSMKTVPNDKCVCDNT